MLEPSAEPDLPFATLMKKAAYENAPQVRNPESGVGSPPRISAREPLLPGEAVGDVESASDNVASLPRVHAPRTPGNGGSVARKYRNSYSRVGGVNEAGKKAGSGAIAPPKARVKRNLPFVPTVVEAESFSEAGVKTVAAEVHVASESASRTGGHLK